MTDTTTAAHTALMNAHRIASAALADLDRRGVQVPEQARALIEYLDTAIQPHAAIAISITPNENGNPPGKLADADLQFLLGPLAGLKLIGFGLWERRTGTGRNVTFPARSYAVNGERRSFALLRPVADVDAVNRFRDLILDAYAEHLETGTTRIDYTETGERLSIAGTVQQHPHVTQDATQDAARCTRLSFGYPCEKPANHAGPCSKADTPAPPATSQAADLQPAELCPVCQKHGCHDRRHQAQAEAAGHQRGDGPRKSTAQLIDEAPDLQTVTTRDGCTNQIASPQDAQPIARDWTAKHESSISAANLQEASSSPTPDPAVLMRASLSSKHEDAHTSWTPSTPRPRRF